MPNPAVPTARVLHDERTEADRIAFSVRTLQSWRSKGGGPPFIKIRESVRYDPALTDAWLDQRIRASTSA